MYVGHPGGQGWYIQEAICKKSNGSLVSYGTESEEASLKPALLKANFEYFWIGLNMCPDHKGTNDNVSLII